MATPTARRTAASPASAAGSLHDQVGVALADELAHLIVLRAAVAATLATGDATPALIRESCGIARAAAILSGEIRQRETHERRAIDAVSPGERILLVKAFLSELGPIERGEIRLLLDTLDASEAVLA